jgi:hypothetical protein
VLVTPLVEDWLKDLYALDPGSAGTQGFIVRVGPNEATGSDSFYTKRFFGRTSHHFFKRPAIEARWNSSKKDSVKNFYLSSSLMPAADNLNKLYLYNVVRGKRANIPEIGGKNSTINLSVYKTLGGTPFRLPVGGGVNYPFAQQQAGTYTGPGQCIVTGAWVETGIYSASFAYTGSARTIIPVWHSGSDQSAGFGAPSLSITGSTISVIDITASQEYGTFNPNPEYVSTITNLKSIYSTTEEARFRLYARPKDWSPTIFTVSSTDIETSIIEDAHFKIFRIYDDHTAINYETASAYPANNSTLLSYDKKGNYFDLDMSLLEPGYAYGIKFAYKVNNEYREQEDILKFRVE